MGTIIRWYYQHTFGDAKFGENLAKHAKPMVVAFIWYESLISGSSLRGRVLLVWWSPRDHVNNTDNKYGDKHRRAPQLPGYVCVICISFRRRMVYMEMHRVPDFHRQWPVNNRIKCSDKNKGSSPFAFLTNNYRGRKHKNIGHMRW